MRHHSLNSVTPPAALFTIEDHVGYSNLRHRRLTGSLKGNRPDQIVSIFKRLARSDRISRHGLEIWFRLGRAGRYGDLLLHIFRGKQCGTVAALHPMSQRGEVSEFFKARCEVTGSLPIYH
jgi:hypothetical protein